jgi:hypothetical protein
MSANRIRDFPTCTPGPTRDFIAASTHQPSTNPHVEYPSRSPDFIIAIATSGGLGLPLMPHHRNGRTGRDGVVCAEPGASASAWFARWQADYGRHRNVLLAWERGEVASMICIATGACTCTCLCTNCSSSSFVLPTFVLTTLHSSDEDLFFFDSKWSTTPPRFL